MPGSCLINPTWRSEEKILGQENHGCCALPLYVDTTFYLDIKSSSSENNPKRQQEKVVDPMA